MAKNYKELYERTRESNTTNLRALNRALEEIDGLGMRAEALSAKINGQAKALEIAQKQIRQSAAVASAWKEIALDMVEELKEKTGVENVDRLEINFDGKKWDLESVTDGKIRPAGPAGGTGHVSSVPGV